MSVDPSTVCSLFSLCDTHTLLHTQYFTNTTKDQNKHKLSSYNTRILQRLQKLNTAAGRRWTQSLQRYQFIYNQQLLCTKTIHAANKFISLHKLQQYLTFNNNITQLCFSQIPIELNIYILSLLSPIDVGVLLHVCKSWCLFVLHTHNTSLTHAHQHLTNNSSRCFKLIESIERNIKLPNARVADSLYVIHTLDAALTLHRRNIVLQWSEKIVKTLASLHNNKSKQQLCSRVWHLAVYISDLYRFQLNRDDNELQLDVVCSLMIAANALLASNSGAVLTADQCTYILDTPLYTTEYVRECVSSMTEWLLKQPVCDMSTHYDYLSIYINANKLTNTTRWLCNLLCCNISMTHSTASTLFAKHTLAASIICLCSTITSLDNEIDSDSATLDDIANSIENTHNIHNLITSLKCMLGNTSEWNKLPDSNSHIDTCNMNIQYTQHNSYTLNIEPHSVAIPWLSNRELLCADIEWSISMQQLTRLQLIEIIPCIQWIISHALCWPLVRNQYRSPHQHSVM